MSIQIELRDWAGRVITFPELSERLRMLGRRSKSRIMEELVIGANDIRNDIIFSMRNSPATGKRYRVGVNKNGKGVYHVASAPYNPPRPSTGNLINSILTDVRLTEVEVGSIITNPLYPLFLEKGTKNILPRPWLEPALTKGKPLITNRVMAVLKEASAEFKG